MDYLHCQSRFLCLRARSYSKGLTTGFDRGFKDMEQIFSSLVLLKAWFIVNILWKKYLFPGTKKFLDFPGFAEKGTRKTVQFHLKHISLTWGSLKRLIVAFSGFATTLFLAEFFMYYFKASLEFLFVREDDRNANISYSEYKIFCDVECLVSL